MIKILVSKVDFSECTKTLSCAFKMNNISEIESAGALKSNFLQLVFELQDCNHEKFYCCCALVLVVDSVLAVCFADVGSISIGLGNSSTV